jgi:hypothetical protein
MYACHSDALPGYVWTSSSDASGFLPGWVCVPLEQPLAGSSLSQWFTTRKVVQLIESFPF